MDVFVTIRNIDPDGKDVLEMGQQGQPVPVAKGGLRASHRALDTERTLPYRPYHRHDRREPLAPGRAGTSPGGNLAHLDGVWQGPSVTYGHSAARRFGGRALYALQW